jgi:hypothetical protein
MSRVLRPSCSTVTLAPRPLPFHGLLPAPTSLVLLQTVHEGGERTVGHHRSLLVRARSDDLASVPVSLAGLNYTVPLLAGGKSQALECLPGKQKP